MNSFIVRVPEVNSNIFLFKSISPLIVKVSPGPFDKASGICTQSSSHAKAQ